MFLKHTQIAPTRVTSILDAAEGAARAIPPAFPLNATVAVNPFLGQTGEPLAQATARLGRVAGVRLTEARAAYAAQIDAGEITDDDLAEALFTCDAALKPHDLAELKARLNGPGTTPEALPTVADLAALETGTDWPAIIARSIGLWAAGHFDQGQALWSAAPGQTAFAAWRAWASHDLTPEIAGLTGFCAHVAEAPDMTERAILRASERLGLTEGAAETAFHRLLMDLGGWSQHARWLMWQAEQAGQTDSTVGDLLAIRLIWEEALLAHVPGVKPAWEKVVAEHEAPLVPTEEQVIDTILQEARELAYQRRLRARMLGGDTVETRPALQAAFCIDVRSEVFRRALESLSAEVETLGFAGFFGLTVSHKAHGSDVEEAHLPVLLQPGLCSHSHADEDTEHATRIAARAVRAWGRFRQAAVSSFAFVEAAGPLYGAKLVRDALGLGTPHSVEDPAPQLTTPLSAEDKAKTAATVLKAMSLTQNHARLILLLGHGASVTNNPHESAYHCGACGGQTGEVSARLVAQLLNDSETRAGIAAHGVELPEDTVFMAGLHDTTTDEVTLYDDMPLPDHAKDIAETKAWLAQAGRIAREERAARLPGATEATIAQRAVNWAELRPEWGLAGCAAFIAAPRAHTKGLALDGRSFLHSYDWRADEGFGTLELILTAPVVVASWISLQYYGSSVAPEAFGGGNKLIHNVTGGIGVVQGNGGRLRSGLPWQAVHDGDKLMHEPLRLTVMVEAPVEVIQTVLDAHDSLRALFDNGWLSLFALEDGRPVNKYRPGHGWADLRDAPLAA